MRHTESNDSNITREIGKNSRVKVKTVVEVWRVKCRQLINEYSDGSFLGLNLTDRWLQIENKNEIVAFLIKKYKRVGFWYKRKGWRVEFHKRVNESIEGFKVTIMGPTATYECIGFSFCVSLASTNS